jgi:hypothetical protein
VFAAAIAFTLFSETRKPFFIAFYSIVTAMQPHADVDLCAGNTPSLIRRQHIRLSASFSRE